MFKEDNLILHKSASIDNKGRLFIPACTDVDENEKLAIKKHDEDALAIYAYNKYEEIIDRYKVLRDSSTSAEDYEYFNNKLEETSLNFYALVITDSQRRIQIPKDVLNDLEWDAPSKVICKGAGEFILVKKK